VVELTEEAFHTRVCEAVVQRRHDVEDNECGAVYGERYDVPRVAVEGRVYDENNECRDG